MKIKLSVAFALAVLSGTVAISSAQAGGPGCIRSCNIDLEQCLMYTPHAEASCQAFYHACIGVCDIY